MTDAEKATGIPGSNLLGVITFFGVLFGGIVGGVVRSSSSETGAGGFGGFVIGALIMVFLLLPFWALFRLGTAILKELRARNDAL